MNREILEARERSILAADGFIHSPLPFTWTPLERDLLRPYFTNLNHRIFLVHTLPENMIAVLMAMYSRLKNQRGLRGVFVDTFLPQVLVTLTQEFKDSAEEDPAKFLKSKKVTDVNEFYQFSPESRNAIDQFISSFRINPDYLTHLTESHKMRTFLKTWLDQWGHNSIARTAIIHPCFENISILAAKSIEWTRPGAGYIELSTRYVDMSGKDIYPIARELKNFGVNYERVDDYLSLLFNTYRSLQGEDFNGPLPNFLAEYYRDTVPPEKIRAGIIGETCDVLGNFLPAATLTSVGVSISGESLPSLIKHLELDDTPENNVIIESLKKEGVKIGANQFLRHLETTSWDEMNWQYLQIADYLEIKSLTFLPHKEQAEEQLVKIFCGQKRFQDLIAFDDVVDLIAKTPRGEHDKLPREFEAISVHFFGQMSFRGWRDLQRMGFCGHKRSWLSPKRGFYRYDKPTPPELARYFQQAKKEGENLYRHLMEKNVPASMAQYPLALGFLVDFLITGNLRQFEFCNWQRSKPSVNHEVRQTFHSFESHLRRAYPWWPKISRANMTPAYIFARGSALPLADRLKR